MDHVTAALEIELRRERNLKSLCEKYLNDAPKGFLAVRKRTHGNSYYWTFDEGRGSTKKQKQVNISNNPELILQLTEKKIKLRMLRQIANNLPHLEELSQIYRPVSSEKIAKECAPKYQEALMLRKKRQVEARLTAPYDKFPYDPDVHVHETDYGERVRSKSEQLLANTLFAYGIPFHYEEAFQCSNGTVLFPDFRILLPDNDWNIWEHFGLLSKESYCISNAKKLNLFQQSSLTIGSNLILTMDDNKGDFSCRIINETIKQQLLPRLQGIEIDRNKIIEGVSQPYMK